MQASTRVVLGHDIKIGNCTMNASLTRLLTTIEIHQALKDLLTRKAPSMNEPLPKFCLTVSNDFLNVFHEALKKWTLYRDLNTWILCLIPKGCHKANIKNWRRITILGLVYKPLAKIMAKSIQPLLRLIRSNQTGFLKGSSIKGNVF